MYLHSTDSAARLYSQFFSQSTSSPKQSKLMVPIFSLLLVDIAKLPSSKSSTPNSLPQNFTTCSPKQLFLKMQPSMTILIWLFANLISAGMSFSISFFLKQASQYLRISASRVSLLNITIIDFSLKQMSTFTVPITKNLPIVYRFLSTKMSPQLTTQTVSWLKLIIMFFSSLTLSTSPLFSSVLSSGLPSSRKEWQVLRRCQKQELCQTQLRILSVVYQCYRVVSALLPISYIIILTRAASTVENQQSQGYFRYSQIVEDWISRNRYISSSQAGLRAGSRVLVAGFTSLKLLTLVNLGLDEQNSQNFFSSSVICAFCSSIVFQNCTWFSSNYCYFSYNCCSSSSSRFLSLLPSIVAQSSSIWPTLDSPPQSCPNFASIFLEIWDICEMLMLLPLSSVAASSSAILVSLSASSFRRNSSYLSISLRLMDSDLSSSRRFSFILVEFLCRSWLKCAYQWYLRIANITSMYFLQQYFRESLGRASSEMARLRMFLICSPHSESCSRKVGLRQSFLRILAEDCCRASLSRRVIRVATYGSAYLHFSSTASSSSLLERGSSSIAASLNYSEIYNHTAEIVGAAISSAAFYKHPNLYHPNPPLLLPSTQPTAVTYRSTQRMLVAAAAYFCCFVQVCLSLKPGSNK